MAPFTADLLARRNKIRAGKPVIVVRGEYKCGGQLSGSLNQEQCTRLLPSRRRSVPIAGKTASRSPSTRQQNHAKVCCTRCLQFIRRACGLASFLPRLEWGASLQVVLEFLTPIPRFPQSQWKALRTTNALERINQEFRRIKTQAIITRQSLFGFMVNYWLRCAQSRIIEDWVRNADC
jgi:Transposase, Mutator family